MVALTPLVVKKKNWLYIVVSALKSKLINKEKRVSL